MKLLLTFIHTLLTIKYVACTVEVTDQLNSDLTNLGYPANEYQHSFYRDLLVQRENQLEGRNATMNENETIVNNYLGYLKWREFERTRQSGFPPSRPIEEKLDEIRISEIYRELVTFPKGGNLHTHEDDEVSKRTLMEIVWSSEDFSYLYINNPNATSNPWQLDFFINPPSPNWIRIQNSNYTIDSLLPYNTLIGLITPDVSRYPTDSSGRRSLINQLWDRCASNLISNIKIKPLYLNAMLQHGYNEGVTYYETRRNLAGDHCIYRLNPDPKFNTTNGKECLDADGHLEISMAEEVAKNFSKSHPAFIGLKRISYTTRSKSKPNFQKDMNITYELFRKYPDLVLGFDVAGGEDAGRSSLFYIDEYLQLFDGINSSVMPLFLHTAETSWPIDLMSSTRRDDLLPTLENMFESILLRSKRIGHGAGFDKYPFLMSLLKRRNIAIEICLVSNQILGFNADLRNHQGHDFYRHGLPIVMGTDDPGTMGYNDFTVDWYAAYISWGLDLTDLKRLALNSLNYSGMSEAEKSDAIRFKWLPTWEAYVKQLKVKACSRNYTSEASAENRNVTFTRVFPKEGALGNSTKVHIFGKNFENAICKKPTCKFGYMNAVPAIYISNQQLICYSPKLPSDWTQQTFPVSISLDGINYFNTGYTFAYKYPTMAEPDYGAKK